MKFEHWYSSTQQCWFIANAETGDALEMQSAVGVNPEKERRFHGFHAIEYRTEEALLANFPTSVNISDKMGD
jgi:hypothetical protein